MAKKSTVIEIKVDSREATNNLAKLEAELRDLRVQRETLNKAIKENSRSTFEERKAYDELIKQYIAVNKTITQTTAKHRAATAEYNANSNSLNALRANIQKLNQERNNLDTSTEKGAKRFAELTDELKANRDALKELEMAAGNTAVNVGNYAESVEAALKSQMPWLDSLKAAYTEVRKLWKELGVLSKQMGGFSGKAAAGGALGVVLLIIAALGTLITYFKRSSEGADFMSRNIAGLTAVWNRFLDDVVNGARAMHNALNAVSQAIVGNFKAAKKAMDEAGAAASNLGKGYADVYNNAAAVKQLSNEHERAAVFVDVQNQKLLKQAEIYREIESDGTKALKDRMAAGEKAANLEIQVAKRKIATAREEQAAAILTAQTGIAGVAGQTVGNGIISRTVQPFEAAKFGAAFKQVLDESAKAGFSGKTIDEYVEYYHKQMAKIPGIQSDLNRSIFKSKITLFEDVAKAELKLYEAQKDLELEQARASRAAAEKTVERDEITTDYIIDNYDQIKNAALTNAAIIGKTFDEQAAEIKKARDAVESAMSGTIGRFAKIAPGAGAEDDKKKLIAGATSLSKSPTERVADLEAAGLSQAQIDTFKGAFQDYITNLADVEAAEAALADRRVESAKKVSVEISKQLETETQDEIKATEYELSLLQEVIDKENETVENKIAASDKKLELTRGL
jgi:hypothetical protein